MEDILDIIAKGEKQYYELCSECLNEIHKASGEITRNNKEDIEIDPKSYIYDWKIWTCYKMVLQMELKILHLNLLEKI